MGTALSVLIVEDSASDAALMVRQLQKEGFDVRHERVETAAQMRAALRQSAWDVVLSDFKVPGFGATAALALLRESSLDLPFILVSGTIGEDAAVELMKAGAHDCVMKDQLARLVPAVRRELHEAHGRLQRRQAEDALRQSEVQLKGILESTAEGILAVDSTGKVIRANRRFAEMWRIPKPLLDQGNDEALLEYVLSQLVDAQAFINKVHALYTSDSGAMDTLAFKDGRVFERRSSPLALDGANLGRVWSFRDITETKRQARALEESEKRFRGLIEQSLTGIYITQDGVFRYANPRLEQLLGYGAGELVGIRTDDIIVAEDLPIMQAEREKLRAGAASSAYEVRARRRDGGIIELGVQGRVYALDGELSTIGMAQDITEKKRTEEKILRYIEQLRTAFMSTVEVATTLSEMRDPYTAGHERRVAEIAAAIGAEIGFDEQRIEGMRVAGFLHDVGKITIPSEILSKPGKLSPIEFKLIQGHAQASYDVLKDVEFPWPIAEIALQHHERIDGSGYPRGLKGDAILLEARIMAVADVVEAMSTHRPYRPGLGIDVALAEIERGRGSAYDAAVADACLKLFREKGYAIPALVGGNLLASADRGGEGSPRNG